MLNQYFKSLANKKIMKYNNTLSIQMLKIQKNKNKKKKYTI